MKIIGNVVSWGDDNPKWNSTLPVDLLDEHYYRSPDWFAGAFLMATKRFAEYRMIGDPSVAGLYRKSFAHYTETSLLVSSFFYAMCATFFIGVFMIKYRMEYIIAMPFVFGLFCFYLYIAFKPDSAVQKPEKLYKEKSLLLYIAVLVVILALLTFVDLPMPSYWVNPTLFDI